MKKFTLSREQIRQAIYVTNSAIAHGGVRPILQQAHAKVIGNSVTIESCDGFTIAQYTTTLDSSLQEKEGDETFEFCFEPFFVTNDINTVDFELIENKLEISLHSCKYTQKFIVNNPVLEYMNIEKVFPVVDENLTIIFDARRLSKMLHPFTRTMDRLSPVKLSFAREGDGINALEPVTLSYNDKYLKIESLVLPQTGFKDED